MIGQIIQKLNKQSNRHAPKLFLAGLIGVLIYNWRLWQQDKKLLASVKEEQTSLKGLSRTPKISVLVAAWNERKHIEAHINSFLALDYPKIELILCAGGSDGTYEMACQNARERVIVLEQKAGEGKQRSLAHCLQQATGEIIYLTDADCLFSTEALIRLVTPIIEEGEQVATGGSKPLDEQSGLLLPAYIWASDVVSGMRSPRYVHGLLGRNAALTRPALERIGGLDFPAPTGTDYQLAKRLLERGLAIRHVRTSIVSSEYPETLGVYRQKQSRWLRNLLIYGKQYGATKDIVLTVKTVGLGLLMVFAPFAALLVGSVVFAGWLLLVSHAVLSKLRYLKFTVQLFSQTLTFRQLGGLLPLTLVDFAIWMLPLFDLFSKKRRKQW